MIWDIVLRIVVYAALSFLLAPKPQNQQPKAAVLEDFGIPTPDPSKTIPVVFGTVWVKNANVLWYGDLDSVPVEKCS